MKKVLFISMITQCLFIFSCFNRHGPVTPGTTSETGALQVSVNIGKVGALIKAKNRATIEMTKLFVTLSANSQDTIFDTLLLTGGNQERTERKTYTGLTALVDEEIVSWTLNTTALDQNGIVIHAGDTAFTLLPDDTVDIALFMDAQYSMLVANFYPIRDSVTHCALLVDTYTRADTTFPRQSLVGDTVTLSFDYLTADASGISHHIKLDVYGEISGEELLLYTGDTTIITKSGEDAGYQIILNYVGPSTLYAAVNMFVSLGKVGTVTINGILSKNGTLYVDSSASGSNSGQSWSDAFTNLQSALANAQVGTVIKIAQGTYSPHATDRSTSFELRNGIKLLGGYPRGGGERDSALYSQTILTGDIQGDGDSSNNSSTVVKVIDCDAHTQLNGVTICNGYGNIPGTGIQIINGSPTITNCTFRNNTTDIDDIDDIDTCFGGMMFLSNSSPVISNSVFTKNRLYTYALSMGATIASLNGTPVIDNCSFSNNDNYSSHSHGGLIYLTGGDIVNSSFNNNNSPSSFESVVMGGIIYLENGKLTDCSFSKNTISGTFVSGGMVYMNDGILSGCTFSDLIENDVNPSFYGGAVSMVNGSIYNCTFSNNHISATMNDGGAIYMTNGSVDRCIFTNNGCRAEVGDGGAIEMLNGSIKNSIFSNNFCNNLDFSYGGAIEMFKGTVTNCTFSGNYCTPIAGGGGGAICMVSGFLTNCTFTQNNVISETITNGGGALYLPSTRDKTITNCIFWNDSADSNSEILGDATSIKNCIVQGGYNGSGIVDSIIDMDPLLGTLTNNGGFVPTIAIDPASPARNSGTTAVPAGIAISTDARGFPRSDGHPDIGAFEVQ